MSLIVNPSARSSTSRVESAFESFTLYNIASVVSQVGLKILVIAALTGIALPLSCLLEPLLEVINLSPLGKKLPTPLLATNAIFQIFIGIGSEIYEKIEVRFPTKKPRHIKNP
jgi:hypothetical protein